MICRRRTDSRCAWKKREKLMFIHFLEEIRRTENIGGKLDVCKCWTFIQQRIISVDLNRRRGGLHSGADKRQFHFSPLSILKNTKIKNFHTKTIPSWFFHFREEMWPPENVKFSQNSCYRVYILFMPIPRDPMGLETN